MWKDSNGGFSHVGPGGGSHHSRKQEMDVRLQSIRRTAKVINILVYVCTYTYIYTYIYYTISSCARWPERVLVHVSQLNNAQGGVKPFRDFRLAECSFQGHIFFILLNVLLLTESFLDFITNTRA